MTVLIVVLAVVGTLVGGMVLHFLTAKIAAPAEASSAIDIDTAATRLEGTRYLEYRVGATIAASPEVVWKHLTDARQMPSWASTIISLDGDIADGQRIGLVSTDAPDRTFKLSVSIPEPQNTMIWSDGNRAFMGVRTFTLTPTDGGCELTMAEVLTGVFLPMIAPKLPDFRPSFDAFIADLKKVATA